MTTIEKIEQEISKLPPNKLAEFRAWFEKFDAKQWDKQLVSDAQNGNLDMISEAAVADYNAGKATEL